MIPLWHNRQLSTSNHFILMMPTMMPAMILGVILMILEVAPPMTGASSVASPLLLRLFQRHLRRMSPLLWRPESLCRGRLLMWWSTPTWITLLDPFALHAPFHHLRPAVFGLMEKDVLCAIMTITVGVDLGYPWGFSYR